MSELTKLHNIGIEMSKQLNKAGIFTFEQLKETGSREAWLRIKAFDSSACYNRLCGLEGAVRGIRWHNLPDAVKKELKDFYTANK